LAEPIIKAVKNLMRRVNITPPWGQATWTSWTDSLEVCIKKLEVEKIGQRGVELVRKGAFVVRKLIVSRIWQKLSFMYFLLFK